MNRTRIVRWLRVILPLIALVMLSTMFLFSRRPATEPQIPYTNVDAEQMAREPRVVAPEYAGVTSDGAELSLRASEAAPPGAARPGRVGDLQLAWRRPDGLSADLSAPDGGLSDGLIALHGGVRMSTSSGWTLEAQRIEAATDRSRLTAGEGITANAPFGMITAAEMELVPSDAGTDGTAGDPAAPHGGAAVLNFSGGVRLIYQP